MTAPGPGNTSGTARLMVGAPAYAVGWQELLYVPKPAAGAQWSHVADGRYLTRVTAVRFQFTASAVVANRFIELQLKDTNGVIVTEVPAGQNIAASTAAQISLTPNCPQLADGAAFGVPGYLPDLMIPAGWSWSTSTSAMDAGDQFDQIILLVQRFPNDAASISAEQ